jgi:hypothetical protein
VWRHAPAPERQRGWGRKPSPQTIKTKSITIKKDAVIGVRARSGADDGKRARERPASRRAFARDWMVDDRAALVAGTRVEGYVAAVERGSRSNDRVRIGISVYDAHT